MKRKYDGGAGTDLAVRLAVGTAHRIKLANRQLRQPTLLPAYLTAVHTKPYTHEARSESCEKPTSSSTRGEATRRTVSNEKIQQQECNGNLVAGTSR